MQIRLDFRSRIPIYLQIIEQIKQLIALGKLKPGDQLPTVRQMATDLRVNFNTIARAYRMLDESGVISTQHGRGTYILEPEEPQADTQLKKEALESLTRHFIMEARGIGLTDDEICQVFENSLAEEHAKSKSEKMNSQI